MAAIGRLACEENSHRKSNGIFEAQLMRLKHYFSESFKYKKIVVQALASVSN